MKAKAKIIGLDPENHSYEVDVIKTFDYNGREWMVHLGHNKLMPMLVVGDHKTGHPVNKRFLQVKQEVTDQIVDDFVELTKECITEETVTNVSKMKVINDGGQD